MESIRVIMLRNWHFDILNMEHWQIAWDLWLNSWVISEPKEWAFVLIIISFIPLWFTGWIALSLVSWGKVVWFILTLPWKLFKNFFYKPVKIITTNTGVTPIKKKKSYKEIRPRAVRSALTTERSELAPSPISIPAVTPTLVTPKMTPAAKPAAAVESKAAPKNFEHALFKFDDNFDDLDFDIDSFEVESKKAPEKPAPSPAKTTRSQSRDEDYDYDSPRERRERKDNRGREENRRERDDERRRERDYDRRDEEGTTDAKTIAGATATAKNAMTGETRSAVTKEGTTGAKNVPATVTENAEKNELPPRHPPFRFPPASRAVPASTS